MANTYGNAEHAFVTIEKDLKAGNIPRLVLLCGKEEYLINWYSEVLIKHFVSDASVVMDLISIDEAHLSLEGITEGLETVRLMSERKVVYLPDFLPAEGKNVKTFADEDVKGLVAYMEDIPEGSMLLMSVFEQEGIRGRKSTIRKAVEKYGRVYDFTALNDKQLKSFIEKRLKTAGKIYMPSVVSNIISSSGYGNKSIEYNLFNLENDLRKIIAYSSGDEITVADVASVLTSSPENNVFAMLDAIGRNRKDDAFRLLHNLLESGVAVYKLLALITGQIELLLETKELKEEGKSLGEIRQILGGHEFRIKKAASLTGQYTTAKLRQMLSSAYEVDGNIKSGLLEGSLALEYFIAKI
ncbi:MAG: DNA polymerase III subunit delta [Clostridiales bacterium]|nr:DNA polymerase III subunit delta [Clostridiales bacterium]